MFKGFTNRCKKIINQYTIFEIERYSHSVVQPEHILIAMLKEGQSNAYTVMSEVIDLIHFQFILESHISKMKDDVPSSNTDILMYYNMNLDIIISDRTKEVLQLAINEARKIGAKQIDTFALFLACCEEEGSIARAIIMRHEVVLDDIRNHYYQYIRTQGKNNIGYLQDNFVEKTIPKDDNLPEVKNNRFQRFIRELNIHPESISKQKYTNAPPHQSQVKSIERKKEQEPAYLYDITQWAVEGKITHIYGRNIEIDQICRVLLRKQKNNPVLVGDAGVGKTVIIEELALRIVEGTVPIPLLGATILQLDLAALTAGTRYRGDFEERLLGVIDDIKQKQTQEKKTILFIDEFHHIVGSGQSSGMNIDGAGILKPPLARGDIACIGITTADEYRKCLETDKAFIRRLQRIEINEMSEEETFLTLKKIKQSYESKHHVIYKDEALSEIVRLARNYIFDRRFPDKAVDLLDEIGAYNQLKNFATPQELSNLYKQEHSLSGKVKNMINTLQGDVQNNVEEPELERADTLQDIMQRKKNLQDSLIHTIKQNIVEITPNHVREVVALTTGIPTDRLDSNKTQTIKILEHGLHREIVGQREAINSLISTVKRSYVGLHKGNRPIGSFMFLGPTGVGKTHTAKKLASYLFGSEESLTRFDMSDFGESNSVNRLVGAPPGYIGYEESGLLLKILRRNPRQILLFDEIEKAHGRVFDMFLQVLEEGKLQGHLGEYADFRHSIIVMTSNIGSKELLAKKNFGFSTEGYSSEFVEQIVRGELNNHFRPEFINRFDDIVVFDPLRDAEIHKIIDFLTQELVDTLASQGINVKMQTKVKQFLFDQYYEILFGARSIRRGIRSIENLIAEVMIDKNITAGDTISILIKENQLVIKKLSTRFSSSKKDSSVVVDDPLYVS